MCKAGEAVAQMSAPFRSYKRFINGLATVTGGDRWRCRSVALSIGGVVLASATSFATWQETYLTTPGGPAHEDEFSTGEPNRPPERL